LPSPCLIGITSSCPISHADANALDVL